MRHHLEPIERPSRKRACPPLVEIGIGGSDEADVDLGGLGAAEAKKTFPVRGRATICPACPATCCRSHRERASRQQGTFKQAFFAAARVGEAAGLESKEFAFQLSVQQGGTIPFQQLLTGS